MLEVGDKVKLGMPANRKDWWDADTGYGEVWVDLMDSYHGQWVVVKEIVQEKGYFLIEGDEKEWGFPLKCIKEKA